MSSDYTPIVAALPWKRVGFINEMVTALNERRLAGGVGLAPIPYRPGGPLAGYGWSAPVVVGDYVKRAAFWAAIQAGIEGIIGPFGCAFIDTVHSTFGDASASDSTLIQLTIANWQIQSGLTQTGYWRRVPGPASYAGAWLNSATVSGGNTIINTLGTPFFLPYMAGLGITLPGGVWTSIINVASSTVATIVGTHPFANQDFTVDPAPWPGEYPAYGAYGDPGYIYGKMGVGDIIGPWVWEDIRNGLQPFQWTAYRWLDTWASNAELTQKSGSGFSNTTWAACKGATTWPGATVELPGQGAPWAYTNGLLTGANYGSSAGRGYSYIRTSPPTSAVPYDADFYIPPAIPWGGSGDFDSNGDSVKNGQWSLADSQTNKTGVILSRQLGGLSFPNWCDEPTAGNPKSKGYSIAGPGYPLVIYKWRFTFSIPGGGPGPTIGGFAESAFGVGGFGED